jgi:hypothetical protein
MILLPLTLFGNHYSESTETLAIPAQFTIFSVRDPGLNLIMHIHHLDVRLVFKNRTGFDSRHRIDLVVADYVRTCHGNDRIMA